MYRSEWKNTQFKQTFKKLNSVFIRLFLMNSKIDMVSCFHGLESLFGWKKNVLAERFQGKGKLSIQILCNKIKKQISMPVRNCIHFLCNLNQVFLNVLQTRGTLKENFLIMNKRKNITKHNNQPEWTVWNKMCCRSCERFFRFQGLFVCTSFYK